MPRAAQEFLIPIKAVAARPGGRDERPDAALAQRPALVRAAVGEREILSADVEHADLAARDGDELALSRRDIARAGDHLTLHGRLYNARALSRNTLLFCASVIANLKTCC